VRYQWGSLAAALAIFAVIAAVAITTIQRESGRCRNDSRIIRSLRPKGKIFRRQQ